jgi:adiponectin receptor
VFNFVKQKIEQLQVKMDEKEYEYLEFGKYTENPEKVSRFPLIFYLFCAIICLGCSSAFHLFNPMSSRAYNISISLDYAGINIFIAGSVFPALYYGMYCYFNVAYFYMTIIMLIATTLFVLSLTDWFKKPENFVLKSICYGGFAFFLLIPISHLVINEIFFHNYGGDFSFLPSMQWYILGALCNLIGLIAFTKRCPDRNNPGKYDVCGHSHQIWHTLVLMGMFFLYFGACVNYDTRKECSCPAQF